MVAMASTLASAATRPSSSGSTTSAAVAIRSATCLWTTPSLRASKARNRTVSPVARAVSSSAVAMASALPSGHRWAWSSAPGRNRPLCGVRRHTPSTPSPDTCGTSARNARSAVRTIRSTPSAFRASADASSRTAIAVCPTRVRRTCDRPRLVVRPSAPRPMPAHGSPARRDARMRRRW